MHIFILSWDCAERGRLIVGRKVRMVDSIYLAIILLCSTILNFTANV